MSQNPSKSVTHWIEELGTSRHDEATRLLWERYSSRIARVTQAWLRNDPIGYADGEDVAISVFDCFFRAAAAGRFERLESRDDLWRLLVTIAARKTHNKRRDEFCRKRGDGAIITTSARSVQDDLLDRVESDEPTPDFAAMMADETRKLLESLGDESLRTVVCMKLDGHTNREISQALDCGLRTVERKLEVIRKRWLAEESR